MKKLRDIIVENEELFDLEKHMKNREYGFISADRGEYSPDENVQRALKLHKDLLHTGHEITPVKGGYVENYKTPKAKRVYENTYMVSHGKTGENGGIKENLIALGKKYEQDSVMHKPHDSDTANLHGTKEGAYPGLGNTEPVGKFKWASADDPPEFHTKLSDGRVFHFA